MSCRSYPWTDGMLACPITLPVMGSGFRDIRLSWSGSGYLSLTEFKDSKSDYLASDSCS
jgi:hypothetical protein